MKISQKIQRINRVKSSCRKIGWRLRGIFYQPESLAVIRLCLAVLIMSLCAAALADGTDILQGTDASLWATLNGTGKKYIYASEGILGMAAYMKTKNLLVLSGIVVVSIFFNIILSIAGESA